MIKIITGAPGAGKSLRAVYLLDELRKKSGGRLIYNCGLTGLKIPHTSIDYGFLWSDLEPGSLIVVDEAWKQWSEGGSKTENGLDTIRTHRKQGYDFVIITQLTSDMNPTMRGMADTHEHLINAFGLQAARINVYQKYELQVPRGSGQRIFWRYPKNIYDLYFSAEVHTRVANVPKYLYFLFFVAFAMAAALSFAGYNFFSSSNKLIDPASTLSGESQEDSTASTLSGESQEDSTASTLSGESQEDSTASTLSGESQEDSTASTLEPISQVGFVWSNEFCTLLMSDGSRVSGARCFLLLPDQNSKVLDLSKFYSQKMQ